MSTRLCGTCNAIFTGPQVLRQEIPHHRDASDFLAAARDGCYICRAITTSDAWQSVEAQHPPATPKWYLAPQLPDAQWLRLTIDMLGDDPGSADEMDDGAEAAEPSDQSRLPPPAWLFRLQPIGENGGWVRLLHTWWKPY